MEEGSARLEKFYKKEKEDAVPLMIPRHHQYSWISSKRIVLNGNRVWEEEYQVWE